MLNLAIVGCGAVVDELYVLPIRRLARAGVINVAALVDRDLRQIARIGRELRVSVSHPDLQSALRAGRIDVVLVASPAGLHAEHTVTALEAGCHVFCEKPMATTSRDAERMIEAATRRSRRLAIGMARRFYPSLAEVAGILARGELGDAVTCTLREGGPYGWPVASDSAFRRERSGGGVLVDVGAHTIDTLCWLFGEPRVLSCEDDSLAGGVEANVRVDLEFPAVRGELQLSWDQPLNSELRIRGSRGEVRLNNLEIVDYERRDPGGTWRRIRSTHQWPAEVLGSSPRMGQPRCYYDCFDYQLTAFFRAILHGEPIAADGLAGVRAIQVMESAYACSRPMAMPWLGLAAVEAIRTRHWRKVL